MALNLITISSKLNNWSKKATGVDFTDWSILALLVGGILAIMNIENVAAFFYPLIPKLDLKIGEKVSFSVLWFTAGILMSYTKETHFLKDITRKHYDLMRAPFVVLNYEESDGNKRFYLRNASRGIARNVKIRPILHPNLSAEGIESITFPPKTIILPNGGHSYLMPHLTQRILEKFNRDEGRAMNTIVEAIKPKVGRHIDLDIEILYEDAFGNAHRTVLSTSEFDDGYHVKKYE